MAVFRIEKTVNYTVMSNYHLRDKDLSCKACGLLSKMLSLPEEWDYTTRGLAKICKDGVESIGNALRELESRGYLVRRQLRDKNGRMSDTEYTIYERPQTTANEDAEAEGEEKAENGWAGSPCTEKPYPGNPYTVNPYTVNPDTEKPDTVFPDTDKPDADSPCTENPAQLNTYQENKEEIRTDLSIYPCGEMDGDELWQLYQERIRENIEYEHLVGMYGTERVDGIVELMLDTILANSPSIRIGGAEYPRGVVRNRLLKLDSTHLEYVFDCMDKQESKVRNIKGYLLAALFNAPATMDSYYRAEVQHDMGLFAGKGASRA